MTAHELVIWSTALGGIGAVTLGRLADMLLRPSPSQTDGVAYHITVLLMVLILSGVGLEVWPTVSPKGMRAAQILAGPICVGLSHFWIRDWLGARQRDWLMLWTLRSAAVITPLAGLTCLTLPPEQQLPAAAAVSVLGCVLTLWLAVRAWLLGDPLAPVMSAGCLLTLPAVGGLYALAMNLPGIGLPTHALLALCAVLSNGLTGFVLWRRDRHQRRARQQDVISSRLDPVTKLHSGTSMVHKMLKAQRRRHRTRRDGAVLAILIFDLERIAAEAGTAGLNEMFICLANRVQRQVGVVNPVGRYYDRCFVSLVETIQSPAWLRTLGLRVASSLRRPIEITAANGNRIQVKVDVGVGVVHLSHRRVPVEDILHDAQCMALAGRKMGSRAAMLDPASKEVVAVEEAQLGWHRRRQAHWAARVH